MIELLSWMHRDLREHRSKDDCLALLETIIRELHWLLARPRDVWLEHVREHLRTNFTDPLSLDDVARYAGMSRFAFVRKFKRLCGRTPMEELRQIRLHEARNLILSCDLPMKMIAAKVGIGDEYQLSKLFRRYFGIAPRDMRNSKKNLPLGKRRSSPSDLTNSTFKSIDSLKGNPSRSDNRRVREAPWRW